MEFGRRAASRAAIATALAVGAGWLFAVSPAAASVPSEDQLFGVRNPATRTWTEEPALDYAAAVHQPIGRPRCRPDVRASPSGSATPWAAGHAQHGRCGPAPSGSPPPRIERNHVSDTTRRPPDRPLVGLAALATACGAQSDGDAAGHKPSVTGSGTLTAKRSAADRELLEAARSGDTGGVRGAIERGADLETRDESRRTPLLLAAAGDHVRAAEILVDAGADPDALDHQHDTPWLVTGVTGSAAMARTLAAVSPDYTVVNRYGGTSLIPAGEHGHVAYVREVATNPDIDVDVNHVNDLGWTALLEAVILGDGGEDHQETVKLLLAAGADPAVADKTGTTALQHAQQRGFDEIARLLGR